MRLQFVTLFLFLIISLTGCAFTQSAHSTPSKTLTVFAAASLTDAFAEMATEFEVDNPHVTLC